MSAQRASGTPSARPSTTTSRARRSMVNDGSPTNGLGLTHTVSPLFGATLALLPASVRGTLIKG